MNSEGKKNSKFGLFIIAFVLLFLPVGSWYYLREGFSYRKDVLKEMKPIEALPEISFLDLEGVQYVADSFQNKISIFTFLDSKKNDVATLNQISKVHEQFMEREDVRVFTFFSENDSSIVSDFSKKRPKRWIFASKNEANNISALRSSCGNTEDSRFILLDMVKKRYNNYDITKADEYKKLVAHIAVLLPLKKEAKPKLEREVEK